MSFKFDKRPSKIDGFGVFTKKFIPAKREFYKIPLDKIYNKPIPRCARIADDKYVDDDEVLNWINHSCDPNAILDINRPDPALVAIRNIKSNEEITVDYDNTEIRGVKIICTCGSESCRGCFNRL